MGGNSDAGKYDPFEEQEAVNKTRPDQIYELLDTGFSLGNLTGHEVFQTTKGIDEGLAVHRKMDGCPHDLRANPPWLAVLVMEMEGLSFGQGVTIASPLFKKALISVDLGHLTYTCRGYRKLVSLGNCLLTKRRHACAVYLPSDIYMSN
uniref:Uncharacterized protein n=1 Tax=Oryza glumipatula TaxID=40148 RepID=A0A0E0A912_9ORYZ